MLKVCALPNGSPTVTANPPLAPSVPLLTPPQTAKLLSICEKTLWSISAPRGPLPVVKIGRNVRYCLTDLNAYIESQRQTGGAL
jgi:hypothetical protein